MAVPWTYQQYNAHPHYADTRKNFRPLPDSIAAAKREFFEEVGHPAPVGPYVALGEVTLKSGKKVIAFAARGQLDAATIRSNEIDVEFPPRSGKTIRIPEVDRAEWATLERARVMINPAQVSLIEAAMRAVF